MGTPTPKPITQTTQTKLGPQQQQIFDLAFPSIQQYASSQPQLFPGTGIAGFSPMELLGQSTATGQAAPIGATLASAASGAQQKLLNPDFMLNPNQYTQGAMDAVTHRVTQNLMENVLPGIRSGATVAGGPYSGGQTKQGVAEGLAIGRTNQGLSDALANMLLQNYTTGLGTMSKAIADNPSVMQQQLFPSSVYGAVGAQQRGLEQAQLDEQIRQFYAQQDLPLSRAQQLVSLIGGMPGGQGVTTVQPSMAQANPWMQGLGAAITGMGIVSGMPAFGKGLASLGNLGK